jgi:hypothetical protein
MAKEKKKPVRKGKKKDGRPSDYRAEFARDAEKLTVIGATEKEMADFFEVSESTIDKWKKKYPMFLRHISRGRITHDLEIGQALRDRAKGYRVKATKIFCSDKGGVTKVPYTEVYPPDTPAIKFWLTNRRPKHFRDKVDVEHKVTEQLAARLAAARKRVKTETKKGEG